MINKHITRVVRNFMFEYAFQSLDNKSISFLPYYMNALFTFWQSFILLSLFIDVAEAPVAIFTQSDCYRVKDMDL